MLQQVVCKFTCVGVLGVLVYSFVFLSCLYIYTVPLTTVPICPATDSGVGTVAAAP